MPSVRLCSLSQPACPHPDFRPCCAQPQFFHLNAALSWESSFTLTHTTANSTPRPPDPAVLPPLGTPKHSHPVTRCHTHASPKTGAGQPQEGEGQGWLRGALSQTPALPGDKKGLAPSLGPLGQVLGRGFNPSSAPRRGVCVCVCVKGQLLPSSRPGPFSTLPTSSWTSGCCRSWLLAALINIYDKERKLHKSSLILN